MKMKVLHFCGKTMQTVMRGPSRSQRFPLFLFPERASTNSVLGIYPEKFFDAITTFSFKLDIF